LHGKNKALAETREEQVSMMDYLDACKNHLEAAKMHMEKGKTLYHDAENAEDFNGLWERVKLLIGKDLLCVTWVCPGNRPCRMK
jgi:hypothetical protein